MFSSQRLIRFVLIAIAFLCVVPAATAQNQKVIIDQDARGPLTTDINAILMFAQSPDVDVLGVTIVTGDQWVKEETLHTLRALEIAGRPDIPVVPGALYPLINSKEESEWWESQFGEFAAKGAWLQRRYHDPDFVPPLPEGDPQTKPLNEHAVDFIIRMVHKYPGEVTIYAGGPLTNIALAIRQDPEVVTLSKQLILMGGGFNVGMGGIHRINGRREFNWWFDPEAVRIVMSAPWKKIVMTPVDISVKTRLSDDVKNAVAKADTPLAKYIAQYAHASYMWDEIAVAAFLDPTIITKQDELYVNIDIGHGAGYGQAIFVEKTVKVPSWWKLVTVQWDLDTQRFYDLYIKLMSLPPRSPVPAAAH